MTDKPILFSAPMIRALLAGNKTQTRRLFKPQPTMHDAGDCTINGHRGNVDYLMREIAPKHWLRIAAGDRLWVKETSRIHGWEDDGEVWLTYAADETRSKALYPDNDDFLERLCARVEKAGTETNAEERYENIPPSALVRPSIFMPRWGSRMTLHVTEVRVQRLQEISEEDAKAEGCEPTTCANVIAPPNGFPSYRSAYGILWDTINGSGSWTANPWVAAYSFTVEHCNIEKARMSA